MSGISLAVVLPLRLTKIVVTPARVKLRRKSSFGVSCSLRSSRSVTCFSVSSTLAPGHAACTTIVLMMKVGSSLRPSRKKAKTPGEHRHDHHVDRRANGCLSAHSERLKPIMVPARADGLSGPGAALARLL